MTLAYPKTEALVTGCRGPGRTEVVRSQWLTYVARLAGGWGMGAVGPRERVKDLGDAPQPTLQGSKEPHTPVPCHRHPHPLGKPLRLLGSLPHPRLCKAWLI